jgi:hypothetical protein
MNDAVARIEAAARRGVDAGDPDSIAMWNRTGGSERYDRRRRWWIDHHDQFAAALLGPSIRATRTPRLSRQMLTVSEYLLTDGRMGGPR